MKESYPQNSEKTIIFTVRFGNVGARKKAQCLGKKHFSLSQLLHNKKVIMNYADNLLGKPAKTDSSHTKTIQLCKSSCFLEA